ncbi:MAG: ABC transporter substrate-binding protein [Lachnospiraceae bacterium]|nr:ABC transporter substrate-binding protein [Lachnospiraceae bacterium]
MTGHGRIRIRALIPALVILCALLTSCASREVSSAETRFVDIRMEGGSGKASIRTPVEVTVEDGRMTARFVWSSKNYDYMIVDGVRYDNENAGGDSTFTVPVVSLSEPLTVIADTVAMSTPHEITYVIHWEEGAQTAGGADDENGDVLPAGEIGGQISRQEAETALQEAGLVRTGEWKPDYAVGFCVDHYGDCDLLSIENSGEYLIIPQGGTVPDGLPGQITVLRKPLDHVYLVSTSAMDLINGCGALDRVRLSGTGENDWFIDDARTAMQSGAILYAGKYRAPDYELLLSEGCDLAIENTMIYHEPAVREKLETLGIPVLVETSSYEEHPLGRLEWIRLYGYLLDRQQEADTFFARQLESMEPILTQTADSGRTVAFFHVTAGGLVNVRRSGDYIARMIGLSGGTYVPKNAGDESSALSSMNMQMEDFYAQTADADILIYNSTIGGEISSVSELVEKNPLFSEFRAVKEGNVYCTSRELFQQITGMAEFMRDLHDVFFDVERDLMYLKKLD